MDQHSDKDQEKETMDLAKLYGLWLKTAMNFWENLPQVQSAENKMFDFFPKQPEGSSHQMQQSWERGAQIAAAFMAMLGEPENLDALFKASDTVPEFIMKISHQVWESCLEAQKSLTDRAVRIGKHEKAYDFDNIDQKTFKTFREIYEKEFQPYFYIPQIGLTRYYQERANKAMDKYNIFQNALGEFIYMFYIPMEKSMGVMQEKIKEMVDQGEIKENYKEYYSMWIKILEGHYMKLLQSPEYAEVMDRTIKALVTYRHARDEMMYDILKNVPVPTNREMDELYKELYELKKKVRELSKKVEK
jgi:class III poly(R)-hydroxyalkanoic acid synthase PhaE subunit